MKDIVLQSSIIYVNVSWNPLCFPSLFCLMLVIRNNNSRPDKTNPVIIVITNFTQLKRGENIYKIKTKIAIKKSTSTFDETSLSRGRICHLQNSSHPKLKCLEDFRFLPHVITKRPFDHDANTSRNLDVPGILHRFWTKVLNSWELVVNFTNTIL